MVPTLMSRLVTYHCTIRIWLECSDVHPKAERSDVPRCAARCMLAERPMAQSGHCFPCSWLFFPLVQVHPEDLAHISAC